MHHYIMDVLKRGEEFEHLSLLLGFYEITATITLLLGEGAIRYNYINSLVAFCGAAGCNELLQT